MNKQEKTQFIKTYMDSMENYFLKRVEIIPENWDGFELRQWISDSFRQEILTMDKKRLKNYKNDVIVNNL